jgi:predicted porin
MKKSLLALAALSTIAAAGSSFAQTNVTIYGVADAGINRTIDGVNGSSTNLDSGQMNGSRIGFRGTEDLGGGLSAIFLLEAGINLDNGTTGQGIAASGTTPASSRLFGRQAYVGLSGNFGTVKLGRLTTVTYNNSGTFDPFGNTLAGDSARIFINSYAGSRTDNTIGYSFEKSGFRGEIDYGFGEVANDHERNQYAGAMLGYKNGGLDIVATHSRQKNNVVDPDTVKATLIGGNYNFGIVKPFLAYAVNKSANIDSRDALAGVQVPVGPAGTIIFSYARKDVKNINDADSDLFGLGYVHNLSLRTALYTSISRLDNDSNSNIRSSLGGTEKQFQVGVRHRF